ncbi:unnamed protein product [Arctogadus glacialis]
MNRAPLEHNRDTPRPDTLQCEVPVTAHYTDVQHSKVWPMHANSFISSCLVKQSGNKGEVKEKPFLCFDTSLKDKRGQTWIWQL